MDMFAEPGTDYETRVTAGKTRSVMQNVRPKTEGQERYFDAINDPDSRLIFCMGPAGTGKTCIAAGTAAAALRLRSHKKIVCVRPAVGAGDPMGFLPGDANEKIAPYMKPILAELGMFFTPEDLKSRRSGDDPEIAIEPVDFMRGMTFKRSFIIVDEAQNCTFEQMKMIITRMGKGTKMIINGDESQSDLHPNARGAFEHFAHAWTGRNRVEGVRTVVMTADDIVRDPFLKELMLKWPGDPGTIPAESRPVRTIGGFDDCEDCITDAHFEPINGDFAFAHLYP